MITNRRRRGGILVVLLAAILGAALAAPAAANPLPVTPSPTSSGKVGSHHLVDTHDSPGATCTYAPDPHPDWVTRIHVAPPVAKARTGHSSQQVGFRYRIQASVNGRFQTVRTSSVQVRTATPTGAAPFTGRTISIDGYGHQDWNAYRVRVDLLWYSSGQVVGTASMWVQHYLIHWPGSPDGVNDAGLCGETAG